MDRAGAPTSSSSKTQLKPNLRHVGTWYGGTTLQIDCRWTSGGSSSQGNHAHLLLERRDISIAADRPVHAVFAAGFLIPRHKVYKSWELVKPLAPDLPVSLEADAHHSVSATDTRPDITLS